MSWVNCSDSSVCSCSFLEVLFRFLLLFGPNANSDDITPELFELKAAGLSLGRPIDPVTFKRKIGLGERTI